MPYKYNLSSLIDSKQKEKDEDKNESTEKTIQTKELTEEKNTTNLKNKSLNEVISELDSIQKSIENYDYIDAPNELNLQKVDVPEKTEDELLKIAKESLSSKYDLNKASTNDSFERQINNLLNKQDLMKIDAENSKSEINSYYDEVSKDTENQALKRGLARSSIIINQLSNINGNKANELISVMKTLQQKLGENQENISSLENEKEIALNNLDIEYAIELNNKLNDVKSEYKKAREDAINFNNNVEKLKAEYKLDLDKQKLDKQEKLTELKSEYNVDYVNNQIKNAKYEYLKTYFDTLDKEYALNLFLSNEKLKSILGNDYQKLYNYILNK